MFNSRSRTKLGHQSFAATFNGCCCSLHLAPNEPEMLFLMRFSRLFFVCHPICKANKLVIRSVARYLHSPGCVVYRSLLHFAVSKERKLTETEPRCKHAIVEVDLERHTTTTHTFLLFFTRTHHLLTADDELIGLNRTLKTLLLLF